MLSQCTTTSDMSKAHGTADYRGGAISGTPLPSIAAAVARLGLALPIRDETKFA